MLWFSKICFFQNFDRSYLFLDRSKLRLKFGQPLSVSIGVRLKLDQSKPFRSIEPIFRSIESRIESFFKNLCFSHVQTLFKSFKHIFSLYLIGQGIQPIFCCFPSKFLQGFSLPRPVRPYCPSFFIYFQFSCINSCIVG